ncbi:fungal-specific transcription factor domain-containing protein [Thelonectria olida]|uniref:Fungal-specific transcription factor domain-containing protein n=1 Tax=Thelonectria olida TaxID=1576542 RepID=A0A9P8VPA0_9HYPO|nr:fungal-specific transcription factor domain-containing protein [Thelonectria olida]
MSERSPAKPDSTHTNSVFEPRHYQGFVFGFGSISQSLWQLHPDESHYFSLWQTFLDDVDPVLKIIHVPTTQRIRCSVSCETMFQEDRQTLLDRYRYGVEQALAKANVVSSPDIPALQALTLYLICARQSIDKQYVWSMTGFLIRLAMKFGLHRDPVAFGLPPFMSEMRRRLWWQIRTLDVRTAEDNHTDPLICEHTVDTKYPANLNDADLDINMTQLPPETRQRSEMLFKHPNGALLSNLHLPLPADAPAVALDHFYYGEVEEYRTLAPEPVHDAYGM